MRITLKFLVKCLIVLILLIFALPMFLHRLDSQEWERMEAVARARRDRAIARLKRDADGQSTNVSQRHVEDALLAPDRKNVGDVVAPEGQYVSHHHEEPDLGPKEFGPQAVYMSGKLGNYEPPVVQQYGPGEGGVPVYTSMEERGRADRSVREYGFNMVVSDKIAMNRTIPDTRMSECKYWHYPTTLPTASVIIVFHNEGFSSLVRTVHSVINTSPPQLLHEVVMVDDFSNKENLKSKLDDYVKQFKGKVKLHRNSERVGLIGTRTNGARYATGDVIVFLDAHCECQPNWLAPLLTRIAYDRTIMAVPIIDGIDSETFRYSPVYGAGQQFRGIFEWGFLYKESNVPRKVLDARKYNSEPYKSPTHAGGLFAMDREYFFELGAYDPGLKIWGGENFELSFKIWQCGGSVEWVPCSRVGHVYRHHMPYGFGKLSEKIPVILINYMRVVEVWLDPEHREYFYTREPTVRGYPIGDVSEQKAFKKRHKCHSFKWFLENVAFEVVEKFPPPPPNVGWGEIKLRDENICWDSRGQSPNGGPIGAYSCHHYGGNQLFRLNERGQLAYGERCIDTRGGSTLHIIYCPVEPSGPWKYDKVTGFLKHSKSQCCTVGDDMHSLQISPCTADNRLQQFDIVPIKTW